MESGSRRASRRRRSLPASRAAVAVVVALLASLAPAAPSVAPAGALTVEPDLTEPAGSAAPVPESVARTDRVVVTWSKAVSAVQARGAVRVDRLAAAARREIAFQRQLDARRTVYELDAPLGTRARATLAALEAADGVERVEPDLWVTPDVLPNDPLAPQLWGMQGPGDGWTYGIDAVSAWPTTRGSGVVVAVLDTGIVSHPDLAGQTVPGYDFIWSHEVANDGNGRDANPADPGDACGDDPSSWHGSHVTGTIVAIAGNEYGVFGAAPDARVQPVRVLGTCGGFASDIADAIRWSAGLSVAGVPANPTPADVLNLSLGGLDVCPSYLLDAFAAARDAGVLAVVAAGNANIDAANAFPANCPGVLPVAAIGSNGKRASFSNYGSLVRVAAPGVGVWSTIDAGEGVPVGPAFASYEGTSMAAPHVAAVAALLRAQNPGASPAALEAALELTARPLAADAASSGCPVRGCGSGVVDAPAALAALAGPAPWVTDLALSPEPVGTGRPFQLTATALDVDGVNSAEARVDDGAWTALSAADGAFDEPAEAVRGGLTAPSDEGPVEVCVRATDGDGQTAAPTCETLTVVDAPGPVVTSFGPLATPTKAASAAFGLEFDAPVSGLAAGDFSVGGTSPGWAVTSVSGSGASYVVTVGRSFPANGTVIPTLLAGSVTDASTLSGPGAAVAAEPLTVDRTPPSGIVLIEDGASTTTTTNVTVEVAATDVGSSVQQVQLSNDGVAYTTLPYASTVPWTLSSGDGHKTVWVRWIDGAGNTSAAATDGIVLDTAGTGSTFVPLNPARLLDSRGGTGLGGVFKARTPRTFQVTGRGGVPADAVAVTGNLTVVGQTREGYVSLGPVADATPDTSSLNFPRGDTRANNVTIPLSASGRLAAVYMAPTGATTHLVFDVTGYFRPGGDDGSYTALAPWRLLDSRGTTGVSGPFKHRVARTFTVAGRGGVPANAIAVTGNLVVVGQTAPGYVTLAPSLASLPPPTSTLNFPRNDIRANGVTVRLSAQGTLDAVYMAGSGHTAHLVFDVTGYYLDDPNGAWYVPVDPARVLESRGTTGLSGPFTANAWRTLTIAGWEDVPSYASGFTGNLTIVGQTADGYVTLSPIAADPVTTSTLNAPVGDVRANGVTGAIGASGRVGLVYKAPSGKRTDLVLDVTGYFR